MSFYEPFHGIFFTESFLDCLFQLEFYKINNIIRIIQIIVVFAKKIDNSICHNCIQIQICQVHIIFGERLKNCHFQGGVGYIYISQRSRCFWHIPFYWVRGKTDLQNICYDQYPLNPIQYGPPEMTTWYRGGGQKHQRYILLIFINQFKSNYSSVKSKSEVHLEKKKIAKTFKKGRVIVDFCLPFKNFKKKYF